MNLALGTLGLCVCGGAAASWTASASPQPSAQTAPPVFRTAVERVELEVWVSRRGKPVPRLGADYFEVWDNGVKQEASLISGEEDPARPVLVLDVSRSVRGARLETLRQACGKLLAGLVSDDQAAIVTFSHKLDLLSDFAAPSRALLRLQATSGGGATSLHEATYLGLVLSETRKEPSAVVLFTDGEDTVSWLGPSAVLRSARESSTAVHVVTVAEPTPFIKELTRSTGGVLLTADWKNLGRAFTRVLHNLRHRYRLQYEPRGVSRAGWHTLKVKLKGAKGKLRTRSGYLRRPQR